MDARQVFIDGLPVGVYCFSSIDLSNGALSLFESRIDVIRGRVYSQVFG